MKQAKIARCWNLTSPLVIPAVAVHPGSATRRERSLRQVLTKVHLRSHLRIGIHLYRIESGVVNMSRTKSPMFCEVAPAVCFFHSISWLFSPKNDILIRKTVSFDCGMCIFDLFCRLHIYHPHTSVQEKPPPKAKSKSKTSKKSKKSKSKKSKSKKDKKVPKKETEEEKKKREKKEEDEKIKKEKKEQEREEERKKRKEYNEKVSSAKKAGQKNAYITM